MKPLTKFEKRRVIYWITNWRHNPHLYGDAHMRAVLAQVREDDSSTKVIRTARMIIGLSK